MDLIIIMALGDLILSFHLLCYQTIDDDTSPCQLYTEWKPKEFGLLLKHIGTVSLKNPADGYRYT